MFSVAHKWAQDVLGEPRCYKHLVPTGLSAGFNRRPPLTVGLLPRFRHLNCHNFMNGGP